MIYDRIKSFLNKSKFIRTFDSIISEKKSRTFFYNLNRSAKSMLLARAFEKTGKNIIFITADDKVAEDYIEDFELLVGSDNSYFLPGAPPRRHC